MLTFGGDPFVFLGQGLCVLASPPPQCCFSVVKYGVILQQKHGEMTLTSELCSKQTHCFV